MGVLVIKVFKNNGNYTLSFFDGQPITVSNCFLDICVISSTCYVLSNYVDKNKFSYFQKLELCF